MSNSRILLIVEGEKTETAFISRLTELYGMKYQIYTVGTNLFALYDSRAFGLYYYAPLS